jgi:beta-lactamase regulating signal transducer with metallopeptidase domain
MNELLPQLATWLLDLLIGSTALLLLAQGAMRCCRQPASRSAIAWGALPGLLLLAVATALPAWPRQSFWPAQETIVAEPTEEPAWLRDTTPLRSTTVLVPADQPATDAVILPTPTTSPEQQRTAVSVTDALVYAWLGGVTLALSWIALGAWRTWRLVREARPAPQRTQAELAQIVAPRRTPALLISTQVIAAMALGIRRPRIVLPQESVHEDCARGVRAALAHEWAHIRHGDLWLLAIERLLLPVFFWHPLFWLLRRQIRLDQELLADAAAAGEHPVQYAEELLAWAKSAVEAPRRPLLGLAALSLWENPRSLSRRIEMVLQAKDRPTKSVSRLVRWSVLLLMIAATLGLSVVTLRQTVAQEGLRDLTAPTKKKKNKPSRNMPAPPLEATKDTEATALFVEMFVKIYEIDPKKLDDIDVSWGEFWQQVSGDRCRLDDGVIVADFDAGRLVELQQRLSDGLNAEALSAPKITTEFNREATVQIGSEIPVATVEESAGGKSETVIQFKHAGVSLKLLPLVRRDQPNALQLQAVLERTRLITPANDPTAADGLPVFKTQRISATGDVARGESLILVEAESKRPGKKAAKKGEGLLIIVITPQVHAGTRPADEAAALRLESQKLRDQVAVLQKQLADAQLQLAWLRRAAAPGGNEKVPDDVFLRRVYLDLLGVPPTSEQAKAFLQDKNADKRTKLIDRLLADPERPARGRDTILPPPAADEPTAATQLKVFALKHAAVDSVALAIEILRKQGKAPATLPVVASEPRTNSLLAQGTEEELKALAKLIKALDMPQDLPIMPPPGTPDLSAAPSSEGTEAPNKALDAELRELEVREAELDLRAAQTYFERLQTLFKTGSGSASQREVLAARYDLEKAKLAVEISRAKGDPLKILELEVRGAEQRLAAAQDHQKIVTALVNSGALTKSEEDSALFEIEKAKIGVARARAKLEAARVK